MQAAGFSGDVSFIGRGVKNASAEARRATVTITYSDAVVPTPPAPGPTVPCKIPSAWVSTGAASLTIGFILGCDGGSPITSVQYERDGNWITVSATSPFVMPEPVPGTTRNFSIRAVNAVGAGPVSYVIVDAGTCEVPVVGEGEGSAWISVESTESGPLYTAHPGDWTGNPTFTYQWYYDAYDHVGTIIEGANADTLTWPNWHPVRVVITAHVGSCSATTSVWYWD